MKTVASKKQPWSARFLNWLKQGAEKASTSGGGCPT